MDLAAIVSDIMKKHSFKTFDYYLLKALGYNVTPDSISDEIRRAACKKFTQYAADKDDCPAAPQTIQKWFGIGEKGLPSREQVYEIAFLLDLSKEQAEKLLTRGLKEPSFQINDYRETIWLYGLENRLNFDECSRIIDEYEKRADYTLSFCRTHSTHELSQQFGKIKKKNRESFLDWMLENVPYFKGYSQTSLDYMRQYRQLAAKALMKDCALYLKRLLQETDYATWKKTHPFPRAERDSIRKYIYRNPELDDELRKNIMDMVTVIYSDSPSNQAVLKEVFAGIKRKKTSNHDVPSSMSEKYLSDLFHVSIRKEQFIRSTFALARLEDSTPCPADIREMVCEYSLGKLTPDSSKSASHFLSSFTSEQKRRCLCVQRSDLLPFILHVTQKHYLDSISYDYARYSMADAKNSFTEIANATLNACNMAVLNEDYLLDSLLLACFQESEMYSYGDLLEYV